jgi:hypothetical protein
MKIRTRSNPQTKTLSADLCIYRGQAHLDVRGCDSGPKPLMDKGGGGKSAITDRQAIDGVLPDKTLFWLASIKIDSVEISDRFGARFDQNGVKKWILVRGKDAD